MDRAESAKSRSNIERFYGYSLGEVGSYRVRLESLTYSGQAGKPNVPGQAGKPNVPGQAGKPKPNPATNFLERALCELLHKLIPENREGKGNFFANLSINNASKPP